MYSVRREVGEFDVGKEGEMIVDWGKCGLWIGENVDCGLRIGKKGGV